MGMRNLFRIMALAAMVIMCVWGAVGAALGPSSQGAGGAIGLSPARALAAAGDLAVSENTGTIHVGSTPVNGSFIITGADSLSGTAPQTFSDVPVGSYTIRWGAVAGYVTPGNQTLALADGGNITFTGVYEPEAPEGGTIHVNANVPGATFTLNGPQSYSGSPRTIEDAPAGTYTITWGAVSGYTTPGNQTLSLADGGNITFTGNYVPEALPGSIGVSANVPGVTFTITGPASYSGTAPQTYTGAPAGDYTITWGAVTGYTTPGNQTLTLADGGHISFIGSYVTSGGTITVTSTPSGALFTISGPASYSGTTPKTITGAPAGAYTIAWGAMTGYTTPDGGTMTLTEGGTIAFTTTYVDGIAPAISGVKAVDVGTTSANITWTTSEKANGMVEWGLTLIYTDKTIVYPELVTSHRVSLNGLKPGTWYNYRVTSVDAAGNQAQTSNLQFQTTDDTPPVLSSVIVTDITSSGATIKWETNERTDSLVEYGLTANYGSATPLDSTWLLVHTVVITELNPQTTYHFSVRSADYWGNFSQSDDAVFTTTDLNAPVISGIAATNITDNGATIVWVTDSPSEGIVEYGETTNYGLVSAHDLNLATSHSILIGPLKAQTAYHFKVKSRDASGMWAETADYTFTTGVDMGTTAPEILFLEENQVTSSGAIISWTTSELATSQVEYGLTKEYGSTTMAVAEMSTNHSAALTGLKAATTYHYRVISTDAANNKTVSVDKEFRTNMGKAPVPTLPTWAWALIGVAGAMVVGVLVVKNR